MHIGYKQKQNANVANLLSSYYNGCYFDERLKKDCHID